MDPHTNRIYEEAKRVYELEPCARTFTEDLEAHFQRGFVFSRPDYFVIGRPVISTAPQSQIVNPWHKFPSGECDCWHCYLMAGNIAKAFEIVPWPLPLLSYERRNVLRFVMLDRIERLAKLYDIPPKQNHSKSIRHVQSI
jgi:hypothetical protein